MSFMRRSAPAPICSQAVHWRCCSDWRVVLLTLSFVVGRRRSARCGLTVVVPTVCQSRGVDHADEQQDARHQRARQESETTSTHAGWFTWGGGPKGL